jgi:2',3'-cyclic-nucleotide 2'-phosphodiesterase (5'-nucleotidase family)
MFWLLFACIKSPSPVLPRIATGDDGLRSEWLAEGSIADRLAAPDDASLVLYYTAEQKGDLAPCGCPDNPRGGLPRAAAYIEASSPGIILNGGYWLDDGRTLDGSPMADASVKNRWMVAGLQQIGVDAVHVGFDDLIGLSRMEDGPPDLPMVSANLSGPGIVTHTIIVQGGLTVGITGVSHPGHISIATPGYSRGDPEKRAADVLTTLGDQVDLVVLFNHGATAATKSLLQSHEVDLVIDTAHHRSFDPPFRHSDAVWVRSHDQGQRLGELRLGLEKGDISWAIDRKIDMDVTVPDQADQAILAAQAQRELRELEKQLFGR